MIDSHRSWASLLSFIASFARRAIHPSRHRPTCVFMLDADGYTYVDADTANTCMLYVASAEGVTNHNHVKYYQTHVPRTPLRITYD